MSQGTFSFPGIDNWVGAEMPVHRGASPSVCTVWVSHRPTVDLAPGTLTFAYGSDTVSFSGCVPHVAHIKQEIDFPKPVVQKIMIYDRRINWAKGVIRGEYNIRSAAGTNIGNVTNAKGLVQLCLDACGEFLYDISMVPTTLYPYVNWNIRHTSPGAALAYVCEQVACTINMVADRVVITPYGTGTAIPGATRRVSMEHAVYPKNRPATIKVVGSPTKYQSKLRLAARGMETDGVRDKLADLSYKPATGWSYQWPMAFAGVAIASRKYAFESVFRWYYAIGQSTSTDAIPVLTVPDCAEVVNHVSQYWPFYQELMTGTAENAAADKFNSRPPSVEGKYWPRCDHKINTPTTAAYTGDFEFDRGIGMVRLNQPAFIWNTGGLIEEAELYLVACYSVTKADGTGKVRMERSTALVGGTGTLVLHRPELFHAYIQYPATLDNTAAVNAEADAYLTAFAAKHAIIPTKDQEYDGILVTPTDGLTAQVTYSVGRGKPATTKISQLEEMNIFAPDFKERRRREVLEGLMQC